MSAEGPPARPRSVRVPERSGDGAISPERRAVRTPPVRGRVMSVPANRSPALRVPTERTEGVHPSELASEASAQRFNDSSTERSEGVHPSELASEASAQRFNDSSTERSEGVR